MSRFINAIYDVPDLIRSLFTGKYKFAAIGILVVFLIVLLVSNKITAILREIVVMGGIAAGIIGYFKKRFDITWLALVLLIILAVVLLLRFLLGTIRQNAINRRIEKRALEKAEKRRGSWKDKRGFSGKPKAEEEPPVMYSMNEEQIRDVVDNETTLRQGAKIPSDDARQMPVQNAFVENTETAAEGTMSRSAAIDAIQKLTDLRDLGVLTDEEFVAKRSYIYTKLG